MGMNIDQSRADNFATHIEDAARRSARDVWSDGCNLSFADGNVCLLVERPSWIDNLPTLQ
jgi:prepilin-type processing-associated H-X9-DG protein